MAKHILMAFPALVGEANEEIKPTEPLILEEPGLKCLVVDSLPCRSLVLLSWQQNARKNLRRLHCPPANGSRTRCW